MGYFDFETASTSSSSNNISTSSSDTGFINQISFPINNNSHQLRWLSFQKLLEKFLEGHHLRKTQVIVTECQKFENYLYDELKLNEKEFYFSEQKDLISYLKNTLKVSLFLF